MFGKAYPFLNHKENMMKPEGGAMPLFGCGARVLL